LPYYLKFESVTGPTKEFFLSILFM